VTADLPIEAVPAKIHEVAARFSIGDQGLDSAPRVVLGMGPCQHDVIGRQGSQTVSIQILIRYDIEREALFLKPVRQM